MKLKYEFEKVDMGDEIINVPVGENSSNLHAVLKLNEEGQAILELLKNDITEEKIVSTLTKEYTTDADKIGKYVHSFIEKIRDMGILVEE